MQVDQVRRQGFDLGQGIELFKQARGGAHGVAVTLEGKQVSAAKNLHVQARFDLFQVLVKLPAQVGQPQRVGGLQFERLAFR
ncbi:hypothetical protein DF186_20380, partial [Enterococcus hirae]